MYILGTIEVNGRHIGTCGYYPAMLSRGCIDILPDEDMARDFQVEKTPSSLLSQPE